MKYLLDQWASIAAALSVFIVMIVRVLFFYSSSDSSLIGSIPDDAFYYLQMAKHRWLDGFWTFDGIGITTGFHLLYGYLLVIIYSFFGEIDWRQMFLLISILASVFIGISAYFTARSVQGLFGKKAIVFAIAPFFTFTSFMQSTAMMESWLVLFFSSTTIYFLTKDLNPSVLDSLMLLSLGLLGSLSRTDFGLLPGIIFSVHLICYPWNKTHGLKRSALVLAGAAIGVGLAILHNFYVSGHFSQGSAQVKFYWSSLQGHSALPSIVLVSTIFLPFFAVLSKKYQVALALSVLILSVNSLRKLWKSENRERYVPAMIAALGSLFTIIGFIIFYRYNSRGLQVWYSAHFISPIGIVLAAIGVFLFRKQILIPSIIIFCAYLYVGIGKIFVIRWPHQAGMMQAGLFLKNYESKRFGSWNAGIISYFSGISVINLDGLANDEVFPFIKSNTLFDYIKSRNIEYIADYEEMLTNKMLRVGGGYSDERFDRCLRPIRSIDGGEPNWSGSELKLFEIIRNCK